MNNKSLFLVAVTGLLLSLLTHADIQRAADGKPDLTGTYDTATVTPVQRPPALGNTLTLSEERGRQIAAQVAAVKAAGVRSSDPKRDAPPVGGDGSTGPSGNVGGYNLFWVDFGDTAIKINGEYRTSIIIDPPNGRYPAMTPVAQMKMSKLFGQVLYKNEGDARPLRRPRESDTERSMPAGVWVHRRAAHATHLVQQHEENRTDPRSRDDPG